MSETKWTPGPWKVDEFDGFLGYDCMTGGIRVGPIVLDGADYGQKRCQEISTAARARMEADARLISAAPDMAEALQAAIDCGMVPISSAKEGGAFRHSRQVEVADMIRAALAKARGEE